MALSHYSPTARRTDIYTAFLTGQTGLAAVSLSQLAPPSLAIALSALPELRPLSPRVLRPDHQCPGCGAPDCGDTACAESAIDDAEASADEGDAAERHCSSCQGTGLAMGAMRCGSCGGSGIHQPPVDAIEYDDCDGGW